MHHDIGKTSQHVHSFFFSVIISVLTFLIITTINIGIVVVAIGSPVYPYPSQKRQNNPAKTLNSYDQNPQSLDTLHILI